MRLIRIIAAFLTIFSWLSTSAQHVGLYADDQLPAMLHFEVAESDVSSIADVAENHKWTIGVTRSGYTTLLVPKSDLDIVSQSLKGLNYLFNPTPGMVLSDSSRRNSKVNAVHHGLGLPRAYAGKGVLMGFIDTGVDLYHEDFLDSNGSTRIVALWDQRKASSGNTPVYGYGQVFDSTAINQRVTNHSDPNNYYGHGTGVVGIGAGDGSSVPDSIAQYHGYAPQATIAVVASDFNRSNWTSSVADGIEYLFSVADSMNVPCVVNLSLGAYTGSHDGMDLAARRIDSLVKAKPGRVVVCAAGNAGHVDPFHLRHSVSGDSALSIFEIESSTMAGSQTVFFEGWADTLNDHTLNFNIAAIDTHGMFQDISTFANLGSLPSGIISDTLYHRSTGQRLAIVDIFTSSVLGRRSFQCRIQQPDSNHYKFAGLTSGTGTIDFWSANWLGSSDIPNQNSSGITGVLSAYYVNPDKDQHMVSSWACLPSVITVGNYTNRSRHPNIDGGYRNFPSYNVGQIYTTSSFGPTRKNLRKPDLLAPGNSTICPARLKDIQYLESHINQRYKLAVGGQHVVLGGTSAASPAVAGTVALLLERCPNMSFSEIVSSVQQSTVRDQFTGALPNDSAGFGKLDVTALFNDLSQEALIQTTSGDYGLCNGKLGLSVPSVSTGSLNWSNGQIGAQLNVQQKGAYHATYTDTRGCEQVTDTVVILENHTVLNLGEDTTVCAKPVYSLQSPSWLNQALWNNNSIATIDVKDSGQYVLAGKDSFNCPQRDTLIIDIYPERNPIEHRYLKLCSGEMARFSAKGNFQTYQWSNYSTASFMTTTSAGDYSVMATDSLGCISEDTIILELEKCYTQVSEELSEIYLQFISHSDELLLWHGEAFDNQPLELLDCNGRIIFKGNTGQGQTHIPIPPQSTALYIVRSPSREFTKKVWLR